MYIPPFRLRLFTTLLFFPLDKACLRPSFLSCIYCFKFFFHPLPNRQEQDLFNKIFTTLAGFIQLRRTLANNQHDPETLRTVIFRSLFSSVRIDSYYQSILFSSP